MGSGRSITIDGTDEIWNIVFNFALGVTDYEYIYSMVKKRIVVDHEATNNNLPIVQLWRWSPQNAMNEASYIGAVAGTGTDAGTDTGRINRDSIIHFIQNVQCFGWKSTVCQYLHGCSERENILNDMFSIMGVDICINSNSA